MWLSKTRPKPLAARPTRRAVLSSCVAFSLVSACGFEPALAPGGSLDRLRNRVHVEDPGNRIEFALVSELENRLGRGSEFTLSYDIRTQSSGIGVTPDQVITRQQIDGQVTIQLRETATNQLVVSDEITGFTSYATTGTTASTAFAREAAFDRLMVIFADRIVARLIAEGIDP